MLLKRNNADIMVVVNSFKVSPAVAIRWCQDHMPRRWRVHSILSPRFPGMLQFNKTAYVFETKEDALLFKMQFPSAGISNANICYWHGWAHDE